MENVNHSQNIMHIHRRFTPSHPVHGVFYFHQSINIDCPSISATAAKSANVVTEHSDNPYVYTSYRTYVEISSKQGKIFSRLSLSLALSLQKNLTNPHEVRSQGLPCSFGEPLSCAQIAEIFLISGRGYELRGHTTTCDGEKTLFSIIGIISPCKLLFPV